MRALVLVSALAIGSAAIASPADELLERGLRSYAVGRYDDAIASFQRGYELAPRADFLYALGQAQRMNGDCRAAVASYRAYLRTAPSERAAKPAQQNLERCEHELATAPLPSTNPPPPAARVELQPATPPTEVVVTPRRRARDDRAAAVLAGVGGAALVAGGALWGVGEAGARSLADAGSYADFASHARDADAFDHERTAGIIAVAVGGALVTVAVARWSWIATHR